MCGCRLRPIDADAIEHRVYADAASRNPGRVSDEGTEAAVQTLVDLYTRIEVGGTVDDVRYVPRT